MVQKVATNRIKVMPCRLAVLLMITLPLLRLEDLQDLLFMVVKVR